jgi:ubiquinone/menaquinone biosynthesis C-methylase UbiE
MLHSIIEKLSDHPGLFLFARGILEDNFKAIHRTIREQLSMKPGHKVLDVACGPGAFSVLFDPEGYFGVDINHRYIAYAKRHYRGSYQVMDVRHLDFDEDSFDEALVFGLLHHLNDEDAEAVIRGLSRVLKPGGRILVIEDIPTESKLNLIGRLLHWVENGHFIRPAEGYRSLLTPFLELKEEQIFRSGICDYYMAGLDVRTPANSATPSESSPDS